jgi:hypothetical protein
MSPLFDQARRPSTVTAATPAPSRAIGRCACGGLAGPGGECAACRRNRLAREGTARVATAPWSYADVSPSREAPPEDEAQVMIDGVVATRALACYGTGAVSVCNPSTGNYDITGNSNTCCTKGCSQKHEERHVADLGPCCAKLAAKIKAGGDRSTLITEYNKWMSAGAEAWTECNAYKVSIDCAADLKKKNACDTTKSTCCDEIADYEAIVSAQRTAYCKKAPSKLPACPF